MNSSDEQLKARGYVSGEELLNYKLTSDSEIFKLLESHDPYERTLGVKLSSQMKNKNILPLLCSKLTNEKKLYTKIALSEEIGDYGTSALEYLLPLLGKIGNNQHKKPVLADLGKKSYPLPRDMAARIIIRIGVPALPYLEDILQTGTYIQITEAVDAIGHITYYSDNFRSEKSLFELVKRFDKDELIVWKVIRALQSFQSKNAENYLQSVIKTNTNKIMTTEAERSLK